MAAPPQNRLAEYELGTVLGKGSFGKVYKAVRKSDGRVFALKQVNLENLKRADRQAAIDEARMLSKLSHPNVVRHYDSFIDSEDRLNILMEYAAKGSVQTLVKTYAGRNMPEDVVWRVAIQALLGLSHVHSNRIIHRDIKSSNLFVDAKDNIKIGDFGIARALSHSSQFARTLGVGTPYYFSPELCEDKPYNEKTDMWALGVVLYECCMGKYPFEAQNEGALIRKILLGKFAPVQGPYSPALAQLVTACLTFSPERRPDTGALLRNPTLVAKAKALGIDLNPRPTSAREDLPVYEPRQAAPAPPPPQQSPQQHYSPPPAPSPGAHPFAGPPGYGSPPPPYQQSPQQQPYSPYQQGQYQAHKRPGSGRSPAVPTDHPFALAGPSPGGAGGYGSPYGPQQGYNSPPPGAYGGGYGQQPSPRGAPYAQPGVQGNPNPWDRMAVDINKMQLRESEVARNNVERQQQMAANMHAGKRDEAKNVIYAGAPDSGPRPQRVAPEVLPAAGARPTSGHAGAPFATHMPPRAGAGMETQAHAAASDAWQAVYQPPQYGRRRNPELQITGPSLRTSARAGGGGGGGGYARAADDATSYTTSYYTSHN